MIRWLKERIRLPRREVLPAYCLLLASAFALYYWNFRIITQVNQDALAVSTATLQLWERLLGDELEQEIWTLSYAPLFDPEFVAFVDSDGQLGTLGESLIERHPIADNFFVVGGDVKILGLSGDPLSPGIAERLQSIVGRASVPGTAVAEQFYADGKYFQAIAIATLPGNALSEAKTGRGLLINMTWVESDLLPSIQHPGRDSREAADALFEARLVPLRPEHQALASASNQQSGLPSTKLLPLFEVRIADALMPGLVQTARRALVLNSISSGLFLTVMIIMATHISRINQALHLAERRNMLVSSASHSLRTPLTVISLYAGALETSEDLNDTDKKSSSIISRESGRLLRLLEDGLSFARIAAGSQKYQREPVDLNSIVRSTVDRYRSYLEGAGFAIDQSLTEDDLPMQADSGALSMALDNVLQNSIKYSTDTKYIGVATHRTNSEAVAEIKDHGVGIPRTEHAHVFEQFYRGSTASGERGWGLGLYIVRHIVEGHGGRVEVSSGVGRGTLIRMFFPLELGRPEQVEGKPDVAPPTGGRDTRGAPDGRRIRGWSVNG